MRYTRTLPNGTQRVFDDSDDTFDADYIPPEVRMELAIAKLEAAVMVLAYNAKIDPHMDWQKVVDQLQLDPDEED